MIQASRAKRKSRTHFEQVPLEVIKAMLGEKAVKADQAGTNNAMGETASRKPKADSLPRSIAKADAKPKAAGRPRGHAGHGLRVSAPRRQLDLI